MGNSNEVMSILTDISNYKKMLNSLNNITNAPSIKLDVEKNIINALNELERRLKYYQIEA